MSLDQPAQIVKHQSWTEDAFLGGKLRLAQPRHGFRAGLDSVLLGAAISLPSAHVLDLGAGVGTASLVALVHDPALCATLVESNAEMLALAHLNIASNGATDRATALSLDLTAPGALRVAAGLRTDFYSSVIANPPYFNAAGGTPARDFGRATARHMGTNMLDRWVKTAAGSAASGGEVIFVYPAPSLAPLLDAFAQRFGAITILPLSPRPEAPATRVLVRAVKGSRAPLTLQATRALHEASGRDFAPAFDAIFRGEARLCW